MIRHLPAAGRVATPWKNGGGVTREIAVFPHGAGMDDFLWRISQADVVLPGPFSVFDGVDRHITILEGQLRMTFAEREITLASDQPGLAFAGDAAVTAAPIGGPVADLNVMTRRSTYRADVLAGADFASLEGTPEAVVLLARAACRVLNFELERYDALLCDGHDWRDAPLTALPVIGIALHRKI